MILSYLVLHNTGGLGTNYLAKTQGLTFDQINEAHRLRWPNFPSQYDPHIFVGYNIVIAADGSWRQGRWFGEETAHTRGYNKVSGGIVMTGNFTSGSGESPTEAQVATYKLFSRLLLTNDIQGLKSLGVKVVPGTVFNISTSRINPHRYYQPDTDCYGRSLLDKRASEWAIEGTYSYLQALIKNLLLQISQFKKPTLGLESKPCSETNVRD